MTVGEGSIPIRVNRYSRHNFDVEETWDTTVADLEKQLTLTLHKSAWDLLIEGRPVWIDNCVCLKIVGPIILVP